MAGSWFWLGMNKKQRIRNFRNVLIGILILAIAFLAIWKVWFFFK